MLFAHPFGCDQQMWRFVAPAFADDYRIVLFDYVDSADSDLDAYDAARYGSLKGYAQDVLVVVHRVGNPSRVREHEERRAPRARGRADRELLLDRSGDRTIAADVAPHAIAPTRRSIDRAP